MVTQTDFASYSTCIARCTRFGFIDYNHQDDENTNTRGDLTQSNEAYMEFELPVIKNDVGQYDGLAVEVHLHFKGIVWAYGSKPGSGIPTASDALVFGVCESKIPTDERITYANAPRRQYLRVDLPATFDSYARFGYSVRGALGGEIALGATSPHDLYLVSYDYTSPVDVLDAIHNGALVLKVVKYEQSEMFSIDEVDFDASDIYVEIAYGVMNPSAKNQKPESGYISRHISQKLSWEYKCGDGTTSALGKQAPYHCVIGGECPQKNSVLRITPNGSLDYTEIVISDGANGYVLPQATLDTGGFQWDVIVTNTSGASSQWGKGHNVVTIDSIPETTIDSPKNTYVNVSDVAVFDWTHIIATGTQQSKYELQGLVDGVWTTLQEETTSETTAVVPADKLSSQITAWRVRTANNDGVYGEYSEPAQVIFVVAPSVAGVTVTGNVRPTIAWQSADQQGYEIMIDGVTTGVRYGTEKSLVWNDLLADGAHVVQVRVVNRFGLFSQWAEATHEVVNVPQEVAPVLTAAMAGNADVQLMWAGEGAAETLVYRDGELIGRAQSAGVYVDHTAYDEHVYRVRVVAADSNYTDSNEVRIAVPLRETMLAAVGEWNWIELAYSATAEPPVRTAELAPLYAMNYYSGREKPVAEMSRYKSATYSVTYAVTKQQAAQLRGMMGKIVVHKRKGELIRGLLQSVSETRTWWGVDLTLQIVEVDEG